VKKRVFLSGFFRLFLNAESSLCRRFAYLSKNDGYFIQILLFLSIDFFFGLFYNQYNNHFWFLFANLHFHREKGMD